MDDTGGPVEDFTLEVRAWNLRGTDRVLIAERLRDKQGRIKMIWHMPIAQVRGFLWLEQVTDDQQGPSTIGI
jgi:hypothetical protein